MTPETPVPPPAPPPPPADLFPDPSGLQVACGPHFREGESVRGIMGWVVVCLLPATFWGFYGYGLKAVLVTAVCVGSAVLAEALFQRMRGAMVTIADRSAIITGLLLALTLPPTMPPLEAAIGAFFAIGAAKQAFGGLGFNIVNPALAARAFLQASFPASVSLSAYPAFGLDGVTGATILSDLRHGANADAGMWAAVLGREGGAVGEVSVILLLAGGLVLIARRIADWRIPFFFVLSTAICVGILPHPAGGSARSPWLGGLLSGGDPLAHLRFVAVHLASGGLVLGAFFMATDMVTSPISGRARIVFACGCGFLTAVIRLFGGYPEGVCYAILLMNLTVPLLDQWFKPAILGARRKAHA